MNGFIELQLHGLYDLKNKGLQLTLFLKSLIQLLT